MTTWRDRRQVDLFQAFLSLADEAPDTPAGPDDTVGLAERLHRLGGAELLDFAFPGWAEWWHPTAACAGMGV